jgi:hypothetical protein
MCEFGVVAEHAMSRMLFVVLTFISALPVKAEVLTLSCKGTGGNQHVTVKHIHQQVNVTEGGQAVVAGDTVTRGPGERRRGMIEK